MSDIPPPLPPGTREPDTGPAPVSDQEHRFPCNNCGSDMRFDPKRGELVCDHCGNIVPVEAGSFPGGTMRELDFHSALAGQVAAAEIEETRVIKCPNCGAQTEYDADIHAALCPFCATPVVTGTGVNRHIKPRGLLPFALDETAARKAMTDWLGRLWFAPNGLQDYARKGRAMSGIYVPYWTFDAQTKSRYDGERGTDYYVTQTVIRDGKPQQIQVRKTRWRHVSGRVARFFDDVLVVASTSLPRRHCEGLEPWDLGEMEPYKPEFLAGFRAQAYQVDLEEGFRIAREHMDRVILRDVKFDIGGDHQRVHRVETDVSAITFKHILLPVWMAAYRYRGKSYSFVVNGRTGRVQGERPWSAWKIAFAVLLALILVAILGLVGADSQ